MIKGFDIRLNYEEQLFDIKESKTGAMLKISYKPTDFIDYVPPNANLYAKRDMILPPFSQNKVEVFSTKFLGSGYVIAPTKITWL